MFAPRGDVFQLEHWPPGLGLERDGEILQDVHFGSDTGCYGSEGQPLLFDGARRFVWQHGVVLHRKRSESEKVAIGEQT